MPLKKLMFYPYRNTKFVFTPSFFHPDSDLLFGAIASTWTKIGLDYNTLADNLIISSAFPFIEIEGKIIYFLPYSEYIFNKLYTSKTDSDKKLKHIKYVSQELYFKEKEVSIEKTVKFGSFLLSEEEAKLLENIESFLNQKLRENGFIKKGQVAKNTIDRLKQQSTLYFTEYVECYNSKKIKTGFWSLLETGELPQRQLNIVFNVLSDTGIGGERSIGFGRTRIKITEPLDWQFSHYQNEFDSYLLVSLLYMENKELFKDKPVGIVVKRKYTSNMYWEAGLIKEGLIHDKRLEGKILPLTYNKVIYGKGMWLGLEER